MRASRDSRRPGRHACSGFVSYHYLRTWRGRSFRSVTLSGYSLWIMQTGLTLVNAKPADPDDWPSEQPGLFDSLDF